MPSEASPNPWWRRSFATKRRSSRDTELARRNNSAFRRVVVAGDSHCLAYNDVSTSIGGEETICQSAFCSAKEGFFAANIASGTDSEPYALHPALIQALRDADAWPSHMYLNKKGPPHILALSIGGSDSVLECMNEIWRDHDFFLPAAPELTDRSRKCVQLALVQKWIDERLRPVGPALALLHSTGIRDLVVLPPPPPHRHDEHRRAHLDGRGLDTFFAPFPIFAKINLLYCEGIKRAAKAQNVPFIDTWPATSNAWALRPEYELDGFHANRKFAEAILPLLDVHRGARTDAAQSK